MFSILLLFTFPVLLPALSIPPCLARRPADASVKRTSDGLVPYECFSTGGSFPSELSKPALPNFDLCLYAFDKESNSTIRAECKPNPYFLHMCESALVLSDEPVTLTEFHVYGFRAMHFDCEEQLPERKWYWEDVTDRPIAELEEEWQRERQREQEVLVKAYERLSEPEKRAFRIAEGGTH